MKRFSLTVVALATLLTVAGCGGSDGSSGADAAPVPSSDSASVSSTGDPTEDSLVGNYQVAFQSVSDLFTGLSAQSDVSPQSTEEANAAAGLDDTTDLIFADYTVLPEDNTSGSFCLQSVPTETYIAITYSGGLGEVDLGNGDCSYDTDAAVVVGDLETDTWTTGGDLMGDLMPRAAFGS